MVAECRDGLAKGRSAVHVQPQIRLVDKPHAKAKAFTETAVIARRAIALILEQAESIKPLSDPALALVAGVEPLLFGNARRAAVIDERVELVLPVEVFLRNLKEIGR